MTYAIRFAAAALLTCTAALTGCAAEDGDELGTGSSLDGEELQATLDELASSGPTYAAGTTLKTIAPLNLRSGPGTGYSSLRVMPENSTVTVVSASGGNAWVNISFGSYRGWGHTSFLAEPGQTSSSSSTSAAPSQSGYSSSRGNTLGNYADRVNGNRAQGWCAREVSNSVTRSGVVSSSVWRRGNAWSMVNSMRNDSSYLRRAKFAAGGRTKSSLQKGSIIGWRPGSCGFSRTYGHVEIDTRGRGTLVCSDFCSAMRCATADAVLYPTN